MKFKLLDFIRAKLGNIKTTLPFIKLFGCENVYGKPSYQNYDLMIANFRSWV